MADQPESERRFTQDDLNRLMKESLRADRAERRRVQQAEDALIAIVETVAVAVAPPPPPPPPSDAELLEIDPREIFGLDVRTLARLAALQRKGNQNG